MINVLDRYIEPINMTSLYIVEQLYYFPINHNNLKTKTRF